MAFEYILWGTVVWYFMLSLTRPHFLPRYSQNAGFFVVASDFAVFDFICFFLCYVALLSLQQDLWEFPENQRMHIVADAFEAAYSKETAADVRAAEDKEARNADERVSEGGQGREAPVVGEGIRRRHPLVPAVLDAALIRALWTLYKSQFLWAGVIRFINTSVQFLPAILVQRLLR